MADVQPLRALHYDLEVTGRARLRRRAAVRRHRPGAREALAARSPYNVVHIDLPVPRREGDDPYERAASLLASWRSTGVVVRDDAAPRSGSWHRVTARRTAQPRAPGIVRARARAGVRTGTIRPHERTHPGPREDRLRLTRATKTNLSPIFSLYPDPSGTAREALEAGRDGQPFGELTDERGERQPAVASVRSEDDRDHRADARRLSSS